jgi:hypothetical protein
MASFSHPSQIPLDFLHEKQESIIPEDLFPWSLEWASTWVRKKVLKSLTSAPVESFELEKCPDCDELSLFAWKCTECWYSDNPDYELPQDFYQTRRSKKIAANNSVIQNKTNFQYKWMEVYRYEKNDLWQVHHIYFRNSKESFCVKISWYIIRPQTISSRFWEESETVISILVPAGEISYQKANLKRKLWQIHKDHSQPIFDLVKHFLQDYHQKLQNS